MQIASTYGGYVLPVVICMYVFMCKIKNYLLFLTYTNITCTPTNSVFVTKSGTTVPPTHHHNSILLDQHLKSVPLPVCPIRR